MHEELLQTEHRFGSGAFSPLNIALVRGQGSRVWDDEGNEYIDCATGIGVAALGHTHPQLTEAISDQIKTLATCANGYYHNDVRYKYLSELTKISPEGLDRVFICNSGTEAVETAIKLARAATGRTEIITALRSFHGRTMGSLSATASPKYQQPFEPMLPGFSHVPFGDIEALRGEISNTTAAVMLEPVQGEAGIYPAPEGYLKAVRELCDSHGALLIFDEIQSGMGRTSKWFACNHEGVSPDIITAAKALGGGFPVGVSIFRSDLQFGKGLHGSTYGGNPLACRAGLTVIEVIRDQKLLHNVADRGSQFIDGFNRIAAAHPDRVRDVRGRGLMLAIEMRTRAGAVLQKLMASGVLALSCNSSTSVRLLPPYIISQSEVDEVLNKLEDAIQ